VARALLAGKPATPGIGDLPADATIAVGLSKLDARVSSALHAGSQGLLGSVLPELLKRLREVAGVDLARDLRGVGDVAAYFAGIGPATQIGLLGQVTGRRAVLGDLHRVARRLAHHRGVVVHTAPGHFIVSPASHPRAAGVGAGLQRGRLVVGLGAHTLQELFAGAHPLSKAAGFQAAQHALGTDFAPLAYVDVPGFLRLAQAGESSGGPAFGSVESLVRRLGYVALGGRARGQGFQARLVLGF
jgi:hypothetical protein